MRNLNTALLTPVHMYTPLLVSYLQNSSNITGILADRWCIYVLGFRKIVPNSMNSFFLKASLYMFSVK